MVITKKQVLKTALLPGILYRVKNLFGSGFGYLAYLIAYAYNTVRILPDSHPYLKPDMIGRYSIRQAIAEAANHIQISKNNIDQIIIFFSIITAMIIMLMQFVLLTASFLISQAKAQAMPQNVEEFFQTPNPQEDIAFRLLDLAFGVPDFFNSKEMQGGASTFHTALHSMFEIYSFGIIIVGAMIILYFIFTIVGETAKSGTPFGRRFNKTWAVPRLILFFGLLVPTTTIGLNGGQYITLAAAKLGSNLATTGWLLFNDTVEQAGETLTGRQEQNVARVKYSDLSHVPAFLLTAKTCQRAYNALYNQEHFKATWNPQGDQTGVKAWAVFKTPPQQEGQAAGNNCGATQTASGYSATLMQGQTYQNLTECSRGNDIHIVFGVSDQQEYAKFRGGVAPVCGSLVLKATDVSEPGSAVVHSAYFDLVQQTWEGQLQNIDQYAQGYVRRYMDIPVDGQIDANAQLPPEDYRQTWNTYLKNLMEGQDGAGGVIEQARQAQINQGDWDMPQNIREYGWGGAGVWYNKIAQQNGALVAAIHHTPVTVQYPQVMELTQSKKRQEGLNPNILDRFTLTYSADSKASDFVRQGEVKVAETLNHAYLFWEGAAFQVETKMTGNAFIDAINFLFGTAGLFDICRNTDIHPLAQLSALGKSMLDSSIGAFMASIGTGLMAIMPTQFSASASAGSSFFMTVASIGLMAGFILFYVLPFMPFLYFFFAVGEWVKEIFEAMVAMPLWALAHLRIDGEGIPGSAAIGGYFLIFNIFIRPILIVVGLLAAVIIFAGMVKVLNEIFYLVIANISGREGTGATTVCFQNPNAGGANLGNEQEVGDAVMGTVDEFFLTILYTILIYMIGQSSFKLIDMIPNEILRWINAEVPTFSDASTNDAGKLMTYIALAGNQFGTKISSSIGDIGGGAKKSVELFMK